ncbi:TIR domain-containing protein [Allosphingosinicella sp.]|uniref:TIR domain-containing protein n=1 Tax=Allosphingosinicella sp. TaxID=2823234 RepID=UPI003782E312
MAESAGDELRYRAFLSYSHKDAGAAGRLHRRLETYRIPKRLAGRDTARGPVPDRLWPIFRDREELPAATDLSQTVREALAQSGALIILCSSNAAGSLWVAEEIRVFRELHPARPVLAAILDGDPPACFPALLRAPGDGHEPLATDLRSHRDGERLGLLKLIAGITGLGLDDLVQRDATRRVRRVMAVTAGALAAMLMMAVLTWFAIDARRDAERQRAGAEGLVEFMLTDLGSRLKGVGRLEVMEAVNARALGYYGNQGDPADLPADSLQRRARVLHAIADVDLDLGHSREALAVANEAHRITAAQLQLFPDDPERLRDHARSDDLVGRVYELQHDWPRAEQHYRSSADAGTRLTAIAPQNPDYAMVAGWGALNLGNVQLNGTRDFAGAQHSYEGSIQWFDRAVRARPRDQEAARALANAWAYLADSFWMREMWPQAHEARQRQLAIVEQFYQRDPANAENGYRLAVAERGVAKTYLKIGDRPNARTHFRAAYEWANQLAERDPRNAEWRFFSASLRCDLIYAPPEVRDPLSAEGLARDITLVIEAAGSSDARVAGLRRCLALRNQVRA